MVANPLKRANEPVGEIVSMVRTYVKQETLDPLRGAKRVIMWGVIGSLALAIGSLLLLLALLRFLQGYMHGSMSWAPYLATMAAGLIIVGLAVWRIGRTPEPR
jgi:ABC-type nickel/cobalt efflux system permease component RcnA